MPIARELRRHYRRGTAYDEAKPRIRARARHRCEQCHKPNGKRVHTVRRPETGEMWWALTYTDRSLWHDRNGHVFRRLKFRPAEVKRIRAKCGVAHLDHNPLNNSDENLRYLCDWCHLRHDAQQHKNTRAAHKDARRPLLSANEESLCR